MTTDYDPYGDNSASMATMPPSAPVASARPVRRARKGEVEAEQLPDMGILALEAVGFKRLRAVRLALNKTGLTVIGGRNAAGKTSVLDAVECLFGGARAIPDVPVHDGEREARIIAELPGYRVMRVIKPNRQTVLEVTRDDGTPVERQQEFLNAMTGTLWFDPMAMCRQEPKVQAETMRRLLGLDFSALDKARQELYEQRTVIGRDRDRAKGYASSLPHYAEVPETELSAAELSAELSAISRENSAIDDAAGKLRNGEQWVGEAQRAVVAIEDEIAMLEDRLTAARARLDTATGTLQHREEKHAAHAPALQALADQPKRDTADVLDRIAQVDNVNAKVRANRERTKAHNTLLDAQAEYDQKTEEIAEIDATKRRQLAEAEFPVDGLGFSDDGMTLLLNGFPLSQASGAEQIRVAVAVAMRMAGNLKVALVDEGEKLDLEQLALLDECVREAGGQVLLSRVSCGEEVNLVIEDGAVAP